MLFGGRVAEEMVFGEERITTGAGNDIERATSMARRMVTQFGMSDVIGLMAVGDAEHEVFLGREIGHRRTVSEHTARQVDTEVKRILDEAHERARTILVDEKDLMERLAEALLDRETLDAGEIQLLAEGKPLPPLEKLIIPGAPSNGAPLAKPKALGAGEEPVEEESDTAARMAHALDRKAGGEEGEEAGPGGGPEAFSEDSSEPEPDHENHHDQKELLLEESEADRAPR
jgi:cell division protease FtsH